MKKIFIVLMSIFLLASTACANGNRGIKSSDKGELSDMKISIQITSDSGSHTLAATLADNSSAMAFYELLEKGPVTIKMTDYGNFEKVGPLGTKLPRND
ncbi:cyclophilin-like fold protein, partial [Treponema sp.]|uniref:cyclophilin-like fold protein n=1 Tax=Treponema sp. TaxID=166 RepID=UPI00298EB06B